MNEKVKKLLSIRALPSLPASMGRLAALRGNEDATLQDFEEVLQLDPALCASILRLANSASFGVSRKVESIGEAVRLLGANTIFTVGVSAAFQRALPSQMPGYQLDAASFWTHSVAVAVLAEDLLTSLGNKDPSLGYIAGLLHDIGKLVMDSVLDENGDLLRSRMLEDGEQSLVELEALVAGLDHCEVGAALVTAWELPRSIGCVAEHHHAPALANEHQELVDVVHLADGLSHLLGFGADIGELLRHMDPDSVTRLGLGDDALQTLAANSMPRIQSLTEAFLNLASSSGDGASSPSGGAHG